MNHWLLKTEPSTFGLADLKKSPRRTTTWNGVRNYQARNMLRDDFRKGDLAFFYHSSCDEPGVVAIVEVCKAGHPDASAFDPRDAYHDPESDPADPTWYAVDVRLKRALKRTITLEELKTHADGSLRDLWLLRRGNRLSVMPVSKHQWDFVLSLE